MKTLIQNSRFKNVLYFRCATMSRKLILRYIFLFTGKAIYVNVDILEYQNKKNDNYYS